MEGDTMNPFLPYHTSATCEAQPYSLPNAIAGHILQNLRRQSEDPCDFFARSASKLMFELLLTAFAAQASCLSLPDVPHFPPKDRYTGNTWTIQEVLDKPFSNEFTESYRRYSVASPAATSSAAPAYCMDKTKGF